MLWTGSKDATSYLNTQLSKKTMTKTDHAPELRIGRCTCLKINSIVLYWFLYVHDTWFWNNLC